MQLDFHYYLVYHVAQLAGFTSTDAETIAYASQYVDDATEGDSVQPFQDQRFDPVRTAHYGLWGLEWSVQKKVYLPFHFLPPHVRSDDPERFSYLTQCATGAPGESATKLVEAALLEHDVQLRLIRLGIALHTIADTFAHFGFSGRWHDENNVREIHISNRKNRWAVEDTFLSHGDIFVPRIGHLEAFTLPDLPYLKWTYRDNDSVEHVRNNLKSSMQGTELIYRFLKSAYDLVSDVKPTQPTLGTSIPPHSLNEDCSGALKKIRELLMSTGSQDARCDAWRDFTGATRYDRLKWRNQALEGDTAWDRQSHSALKSHLLHLKGKPGFETSRWACFHRAAWKQRALVIGWLN